MCQSLLKSHLEIAFHSSPTNPVQIAMGEPMGGIVADHGPPFATCQDFKLHSEPANPATHDLITRTHSCVEIKLAFILDISQFCRPILPNRTETDAAIIFSNQGNPRTSLIIISRLSMIKDQGSPDGVENQTRILPHKSVPRGFFPFHATSEKSLFLLGHRPKAAEIPICSGGSTTMPLLAQTAQKLRFWDFKPFSP